MKKKKSKCLRKCESKKRNRNNVKETENMNSVITERQEKDTVSQAEK